MSVIGTITYGADDATIASYRDRLIDSGQVDVTPPLLRTSEPATITFPTPAVGTGYRVRVQDLDSSGNVIRTVDSATFDVAGPPPAITRTLTVTIVGVGTVTPATGSTYADDEVVAVTATAATGYVFSGWSGNVTVTGSGTGTITMDSDKTITATFTLVPPPQGGSSVIVASSSQSGLNRDSRSVTLSNVEVGDSLIAICTHYHEGGGTVQSVTASGESALSLIEGPHRLSGTYALTVYRLATVTVAGNKTVTATWTGPFLDVALTVIQARGLDPACMLEASALTSIVSATPSVTLSLGADNDFIVAVMMHTSGGILVSSPYTSLSLPDHTGSTLSVSGQTLDDAGPRGALNVPMTFVPSGSQAWMMLAMGFRVGQLEDTTPPTGSIVSPEHQAIVSGDVLIEIETDDPEASVTAFVDGFPLSPVMGFAPYRIVWHTENYSNTQHTITALMRDQAGNEAFTSSITVTTNNADAVAPGDRSVMVRWTTVPVPDDDADIWTHYRVTIGSQTVIVPKTAREYIFQDLAAGTYLVTVTPISSDGTAVAASGSFSVTVPQPILRLPFAGTWVVF